MNKYYFSPIGIMHSPFKEKFGVPRQARLMHSYGTVEMYPEYSQKEAYRELENFSHIWLLFIFHKFEMGDWSPTARPPRLGGNKRVGLFASRSPRRPNRLGMSAVGLEKIEFKKDQAFLHVTGIDLIEGTPIVDIRPYIKEGDSITDAKSGWTQGPSVIPKIDYQISYSPQVLEFCQTRQRLLAFITEMVKLDPRPGYYKANPQDQRKSNFASLVHDVDVHWEVEDDKIYIKKIIPT